MAIARSLALEPQILLMDEPFSALDEPTRLEMQELVVELWHRVQPTIFCVTHSVTEAVYLGERVWIFSHAPGQIAYDICGFDPARRGDPAAGGAGAAGVQERGARRDGGVPPRVRSGGVPGGPRRGGPAGRSMKPGFSDYIREAFNARPIGMFVPPNWIGIGAFALLGLVNPGFWVMGAGLELAYLGILSTNPRFQRYVDADRRSAESGAAWQERVDQLVTPAGRRRPAALPGAGGALPGDPRNSSAG